jgi:hypothetical protein
MRFGVSLLLPLAALSACTAPPVAEQESDPATVTCSTPERAAAPAKDSVKGPRASTQRSDGAQSDCPTCPPPC